MHIFNHCECPFLSKQLLSAAKYLSRWPKSKFTALLKKKKKCIRFYGRKKESSKLSSIYGTLNLLQVLAYECADVTIDGVVISVCTLSGALLISF